MIDSTKQYSESAYVGCVAGNTLNMVKVIRSGNPVSDV